MWKSAFTLDRTFFFFHSICTSIVVKQFNPFPKFLELYFPSYTRDNSINFPLNFSLNKIIVPRIYRGFHQPGGGAPGRCAVSWGDPIRGGIPAECVERIPHLYSLLVQYRRDGDAHRYGPQPHHDWSAEKVTFLHRRRLKKKQRNFFAAVWRRRSFDFPATSQTVTSSTSAPGSPSPSLWWSSSCSWDGCGSRISMEDWTHGNMTA